MTSTERQDQPYIPSLEDLLPRGMSSLGFLKRDQTLEQVLARDKAALDALGYTAKEVADLLVPLIQAANQTRKESFTYCAPNGKEYTVQVQRWLGYQECPWRHNIDWHTANSAIDLFLTEKGTDTRVHIAGLLPHLIAEHDFFEGGRYRVAPEVIVAMFGVERVPGSLERAGSMTL